jgi:hypothetical protein
MFLEDTVNGKITQHSAALKVKLSHQDHEGTKGERSNSSYSLFTLALDGHAQAALCPCGMDPRYPLDSRLGGPQRWSEHRGSRKNPLPLPGIEPWSYSQTLH